jgi:hypothetical protein
MGRGEVPKKHRDIRTQENRDPMILETRGKIIAVKLGWTCVKRFRRVEIQRIRVLEHVEILSHEIAIHEFVTRSGPFILVDTWQRTAPSGKSRQGVNPSVI